MNINLKRLIKENEGKEFRVLDYNFRIIDFKLNLRSEMTYQFNPIYLDHMNQGLLDKIEEVLLNEKRAK